jgi:Activator of Hsp90 ATPase homolog 1-like protein
MAKAVDSGMVVRTAVTVPIAPADAFRLFTDGMSTWWPLPSHSVYDTEATGVVIEPRVGGRVYETTADGRTADWGIISAWEPGEHLAMSWHPGNEPGLATHVDIHFVATDDGGTMVDVVHTGWEVRGADAPRAAASYDTGWKFVLGRFVDAA